MAPLSLVVISSFVWIQIQMGLLAEAHLRHVAAKTCRWVIRSFLGFVLSEQFRRFISPLVLSCVLRIQDYPLGTKNTMTMPESDSDDFYY